MGLLTHPEAMVKCANCGEPFPAHIPSDFIEHPGPDCPDKSLRQWKAPEVKS
jgi:hypothetical protein